VGATARRILESEPRKNSEKTEDEPSMTKSDTARAFMMACDGGEGWEVCSQYCTPEATFSVQAGALDGVDTLAAYTEWAKGLDHLAFWSWAAGQ
jgi:hypothetical protein